MTGRFYSYLNTAEYLVSTYRGDIPLHHFLRGYFREHSKYGSRDRREISSLCYACYRTGAALKDKEVRDKILASFFLVAEEKHPLLDLFRPDWNSHADASVKDKLGLLEKDNLRISVTDIFPLADGLSQLIDNREGFVLSHICQPRLFLRIRPGKHERVEEQLKRAGVPYNIAGNTVELPNGTDLSRWLEGDREVVVQDLSSQGTGTLIDEAIRLAGPSASVWDCCAASGGKSLLAYDLHPGIRLTVSDIRTSILENLKQRFHHAGLKHYRSFTADLSAGPAGKEQYDVVIADVPCSGSGTWGRTPEQMMFFGENNLLRYRSLQEKIITHVAPSVKPGGTLLYFTCSAYAAENEQMAAFITAHTGLKMTHMELLQGWTSRADTMFMAAFRA